jgi:pyridoxamine 5'-phosphate oxidase-like protein
MASWGEVCRDAPEFAARVQAAFTRKRHMTLATLRHDGAPRISGTEMQFDGDYLVVGMMPGSRKLRDVRRDPRIAIHGPTADPPEENRDWVGEAKLSGRAVEVPGDDPEHEGYGFRIDVDEVVFTHLNDAGDRLVIESWHPGRGVEVVERE